MDGLPVSPSSATPIPPQQAGAMSDQQPPVQAPVPAQPVASQSSIGGKERESGYYPEQKNVVTDLGKEMNLPKEVAEAGVRLRPSSIELPPPVSGMGVKPAGPNVPFVTTTSAVTLPLTDDQIAYGLHQGLATSWRWLAEWCMRRLKQMHVGLKAVGGRLVRVRG